ncbi:MAG: hypothetical protein J6W41_03005 [Alphaproteobacteria bacterium]|nr:hypothetical protein [Alphaproteobacteria bacterium]
MKPQYIATLIGGVICAYTNVAISASRSTIGNISNQSRMTTSGTLVKLTTESNKSNIAVVSDTPMAPKLDLRDKEKQACIGNRIGNTFVWASRYSNIDNYSSMIEDTEFPDNNVCFVRVELKSRDSRINTSDFQGKYFVMGDKITCGNWVNEEKLEQRILDAKKSKRTLATVAGSIGGAAVGVGAMESFGNKMIGGTVQGQQALSGDALLISQLRVLKQDNKSEYNKIISELKTLKSECEKNKNPDTESPCKKYNATSILSGVGEK